MDYRQISPNINDSGHAADGTKADQLSWEGTTQLSWNMEASNTPDQAQAFLRQVACDDLDWLQQLDFGVPSGIASSSDPYFREALENHSSFMGQSSGRGPAEHTSLPPTAPDDPIKIKIFRYPLLGTIYTTANNENCLLIAEAFASFN